ncbi:phosphatase PAP2 family protein [Bradyrhizobium valentinum]|uniref:Phosphoesterase n=1 Tax=Bradyrhizobium valentinum TaxID=1518501 RepID=A0A0R3LJF7_9BRAD|nr:phosphatase PAP2 family protein [Bradyrhizobium valentinum]KRR03036.1 phosphoesterase [Bradyrhizobium valentinum]KRR07810.1 phosphoesterase [Bradyrhizobium valentinum]
MAGKAVVVVDSKSYFARFMALSWLSLAQLVRSPSHSRRAEAARRAARHVLWLTAGLGAAIVVLMYAIDAWEIGQMPKRGAPSLWWVRILTDFGKDEYVLAVLAGLLIAVAIISPALRGIQRSLLLGLGTRLQFLFLAVAVPALVTEVLKYSIGRGRPFVGGEANAFHFSHFAGNSAYYSFPSGHATTAFALAFAVSALWPKARVVMAVYALIIAATRLVLVAHHPSDVVAGALVGIIGAMFVRYWFAARRLGFAIQSDGSIVSLVGPSSERLKRVARGAFAP